MIKPVRGYAGKHVWYDCTYNLYCITCKKSISNSSHKKKINIAQAHAMTHDRDGTGRKIHVGDIFYYAGTMTKLRVLDNVDSTMVFCEVLETGLYSKYKSNDKIYCYRNALHERKKKTLRKK